MTTKSKARRGAEIGRAFVHIHYEEYEVRGTGDYCGLPIMVRLVPETREKKAGWRVVIHIHHPIEEPAGDEVVA